MIKGYITNLGKYNEGILMGKWISFPIDEEELEKVFAEIGINEQYEEIFFTDWESPIPLGEFENIDYINDLAVAIEDAGEKLAIAIAEEHGTDEVFNHRNYYLREDVQTDKDLGYVYAEEYGCIEIPDHLTCYFDYEAYGRNISLSGVSGTMTEYGWLENC